MGKIISFYSFCRKAGKSDLAVNITALLGKEGRRVCLVDADLTAPNLHTLIGLDEKNISFRLNDYLAGRCSIEQTLHDVTPLMGEDIGGKVHLIPSSTRIADISRLLCEGCEMDLLSEGFRRLHESLELDAVIVDTHAGLNEETLLSFALTDVLAIVVHPGRRQDCHSCQGTAVTVDIVRKLDEPPHIVLILNNIPEHDDFDELKKRVERAYACEVAVMLPQSPEMAESGIFVLSHPDHPLTAMLRQLAQRLINPTNG